MPRWTETSPKAKHYDITLTQTKRGLIQHLKKPRRARREDSEEDYSSLPLKQALGQEAVNGHSGNDSHHIFDPDPSSILDQIPPDPFNVYYTGDDLLEKPANTSHEYMKQWIPLRRKFLDCILDREAPPEDVRCSQCKIQAFKIRCNDCLGLPVFCVNCCQNIHDHHPFHRIEIWSGDHFSAGWLWQTGVSIHLGHGGSRCPCNEPIDERVEISMNTLQPSTYISKKSEGETPDDNPWLGSNILGQQLLYEAPGIVVVHTNAVHRLPIFLCSCPSAADPVSQYLQMGYYPSTYKRIETVFTFQVLEDYRLENLECQTSCHHYYSKLRRMTNSIFPQSIPVGLHLSMPLNVLHFFIQDRKRELARAERQWRNLKEWKWFGFGHGNETPKETQLALFCPTCPQPGVNIPHNWHTDSREWKFIRSFAIDGNFVAVHQQQLRTTDDVWIKDGEGYMTKREPYHDHLQCTLEEKEPCTCNEHRAVLDRSKPHKGCDVTGIGAFACLRHGCYCPGSIVDFQKGERQMNIDYGLVQALNNTRTSLAPKVISVYDINCQYSRNLQKRVEKGKYLNFQPGLTLVAGIGMFHVHGHQDVCYGRFAPRFIPGAGQTDGEVLERLFSVLNGISTICRTMTLAHRSETLDAHMGDSNFKKMIDMVPTLCKKWKAVCASANECRHDFEVLTRSATPEQRESWIAAIEQAEHFRERGKVEAMDIYNVKSINVVPLAVTQATLMEAEQGLNSGIGITAWIVSGMKIQEAQSELVWFIRRQGKRPSGEQRVQINQKREALRRKIDQFHDSFTQLFPSVDLDDTKLRDIPYGDDVLEEDDDELYLAHVPRGDVEKTEVCLPSTYPRKLLLSFKEAGKVELALRMSQADNSLEIIRRELGHKSFLYRNDIALSTNKQMKTRGYAAVKAADQELRKHVRFYNQARNALLALECSDLISSRYKPLLPEQLVPLKSIYEPNSRGQGNYSMPWFWSLQVGADSEDSEYMDECAVSPLPLPALLDFNISVYRVNWMRARAKFLRWEEESILIPAEMEWTVLFFRNRADEWKLRENQSARTGHKIYARKQIAMWAELAKHSQDLINACFRRYTIPASIDEET